MRIVIKDRWIFDKTFEDDEIKEAVKYVDRCNALYQGHYELTGKISDEEFSKGLHSYTRIVTEAK